MTVVIFFSDLENSYGDSYSSSDYFEELLKYNKQIKIDYGKTPDVKKKLIYIIKIQSFPLNL